MEINIKKTITVSVHDLVDAMTVHELMEFCDIISKRLDADFTERSVAAKNLSNNLSENGCRFLADVVTHHSSRNIAHRMPNDE